MLRIFFPLFIFAATAFAQVENLNTVRIRLFRDLENFPQIEKAQISRLSDRVWSITGSNLIFKNRKIAFQNLIVKKSNSKFDLITQLDFDQYLAGVVASEMPSKWPEEALKTQAIVARSYALARMKERKDKFFDLESDQMDQVFNGAGTAKTLAAVLKTQNIVLKTSQGEILKAFFHADCGGQTIPASKVWATEKDTGTAIDPWCRKRKSNEWSFNLPEEQFLKALQKSETNSVDVGATFNQKIQSIQVDFTQISIQKLRQIFGFANIRNSPERFEIQNHLVQISGKGFGHGAGLCQWGTLEQARLGFSYLEILKHYYPQAVVSDNEIRLTQNSNSE